MKAIQVVKTYDCVLERKETGEKQEFPVMASDWATARKTARGLAKSAGSKFVSCRITEETKERLKQARQTVISLKAYIGKPVVFEVIVNRKYCGTLNGILSESPDKYGDVSITTSAGVHSVKPTEIILTTSI